MQSAAISEDGYNLNEEFRARRRRLLHALQDMSALIQSHKLPLKHVLTEMHESHDALTEYEGRGLPRTHFEASGE